VVFKGTDTAGPFVGGHFITFQTQSCFPEISN
jgi:hypothetical protein